jgi:lysine-specific demethylase 3
MRQRAHDEGASAGALWHIFHPSDTVKIRDMLKSIAVKEGKRLNPHDDPIHDQSTYLDDRLRQRLYEDYGVRGILSYLLHI